MVLLDFTESPLFTKHWATLGLGDEEFWDL